MFEPGADDGTEIRIITTDTLGRYSFLDLSNTVTYFVHIDDSQTPLSGMSLTTADDEPEC